MNNTKIVYRQACQGDVTLTKVAELPAGVRKATPGPNGYVVTHSESGHHHVIADVAGIEFFDTADPFVCYLQVSQGAFDGQSSVLRHLKGGDYAHEPHLYTPGVWEVKRQQERAGESWVRAQD